MSDFKNTEAACHLKNFFNSRFISKSFTKYQTRVNLGELVLMCGLTFLLAKVERFWVFVSFQAILQCQIL